MFRLIGPADFKCVGLVANNCNLSKLNIAIEEAQQYDIGELFCDLWTDISEVFSFGDFNDDFNGDYSVYTDSYSEIFTKEADIVKQSVLWSSLMDGGVYVGCNGKKRRHVGIKRILTRYAYARYLKINSYDDTATGAKHKTDPFAIGLTYKEIDSYADKYRTMGRIDFKDTLDFICHNKKYFVYKPNDCAVCVCDNGDCGEKTKAKGYGFKSRTIKKNI